MTRDARTPEELEQPNLSESRSKDTNAVGKDAATLGGSDKTQGRGMVNEGDERGRRAPKIEVRNRILGERSQVSEVTGADEVRRKRRVHPVEGKQGVIGKRRRRRRREARVRGIRDTRRALEEVRRRRRVGRLKR